MCSSLPLDILAQVTALGSALVAAAQKHGDAPLEELETAVRTTVQAALPGLLGAVVHLTSTDLDPGIATVHRRCPGCTRLVRMHGQRPRTVQTTCGALTVVRPWYHCASCGQGFSPADSTLALPRRARISPALEAWLVRLNVSTTQREAAALLTALTGLVVGMDTIREHTTTVGTAVAAEDRAAIAQVQRTGESEEPVVPAPGRLVVETDGAMVRYTDGWHEVKIGVVGGVVDGRVTSQSYVAARETAEAFGPRLLTEAARRGALDVVRWDGALHRPALAVLRSVHVLGDGAPWIWNLAEDHFGERTEAVDFYHAAEHVWTAARAVHGEGTPAATAWAQARIDDLKEHGGAPVHAALFALAPATPAAVEVVRLERGYFTTNLARMAYPDLQAQGLPIGSGAVESSAHHLVQHRMKRPGQRWTCHGGRAMLALRGRFTSGRSLRVHASSAKLQH